MHSLDIPIASPATTCLGARGGPTSSTAIIEDEPGWRLLPHGALLPSPVPRITATRWRTFEERTREVSAETPSDCHVIAIVLRNENIRLSVSGRTVHDGAATPGMLHVTEPAVPVRCIFHGPYDVIHLHVPNGLIAEFDREIRGRESAVLCSGKTLTRDPIMEPLGRALLDAEEIGDAFGRIYADSVTNAILARLLILTHRSAPWQRSKAATLAPWRLRRAIDYIEGHLAESVSLSDIALAAGLTRMHFAAQFKASTGLRPHEYLLRRRIEHAQEMLTKTRMSVIEVALSVGFQTPSHFTTVFKRLTAQSPNAWRRSQQDGTIPLY